MIKRKPYHCLVALLCAFCFIVGLNAAPPPASALDLGGSLGTVLKIGGIALVVRHFGDEIDSFINTLLGQKGLGHEGKTKVVPVIRIGAGTAVGAVQVVGPEQQVRKVQAVAELELSLGNSLRARALVPITTRRAETSSIRGVGGVGVSANIKFPL
jgi:hypothetical protein